MKGKKGIMAYGACCTSQVGLVHVVGGIGVGFLLVNYLGLTDVLLWGWALVVLAVLGHFVGKMKY